MNLNSQTAETNNTQIATFDVCNERIEEGDSAKSTQITVFIEINIQNFIM